MPQGASSLPIVALACIGLLSGCGKGGSHERWYEQGQQPQTQWEQKGAEFVGKLLQSDFAAAHRMLATELKAQVKEQDLEQHTLALVSEQFRPMDSPWVLTSLTAWPAKGFSDLGWVYVQIGGDNNEAIAVVVTRESGELRIKEIAWGRP
jgi:hypothetical protein